MDNKQIQEMYYHNKHRHCFIVEDGNETLAATVYGSDAELYGTLLAEAFNVKHQSGKGPKELWEALKASIELQEVSKECTRIISENAEALAERVKELEVGIQYFIDRVEAGTIRSVETYGKYKALLNK